MLSRRAILLISFVVALVVHGILFALAPRVSMLQVFSMREDVLRTIRVELKDIPPPVPARSEEFVVASRPGEVRDLLRREEELLQPEPLAPQPAAPLPDLAERLAADPLEREYDLERDEETLRRVDAKILEIASEDARRDLDVARRLVRPSPERLLEEGELPSLRSSLATNDDPLRFEFPTRSLLAEAYADRDVAIPQATAEPLPAPEQAPAMQPLVELLEEQVARAPLERAVQEARRESAYTFLDELVDINLDSYVAGAEGFFRLRITPRQGQEMEVLPKDVTFIIDASGSIPQFKLNTTANGVARALQYLRPEDKFNLVAFRDSPDFFQPQLIPATPENKSAAEKYLRDLQSRGQTNVYEAILPVLRDSVRAGAASMAIVLSDGRPTTGIQDARVIINGLTGDNALRRGIYAFGGGNTVNRYLLDLLAYRNKGTAQVVDSVDAIDETLPEFFARLPAMPD